MSEPQSTEVWKEELEKMNLAVLALLCLQNNIKIYG